MTQATELERKTPAEWLATADYDGITILDPDGWDRTDFEASWNEPITRHEFTVRLGLCTCVFPASYFDRANQQ